MVNDVHEYFAIAQIDYGHANWLTIADISLNFVVSIDLEINMNEECQTDTYRYAGI